MTDEAINAYKRYVSLVPEDGEARYYLGLLYMAKGMRSEAAAAFEAASRHISPCDAERATNLGACHLFRGDIEKAVGFFNRALALDASFVPARYYLGIAYLEQGRCREAITELESVAEAEPDHLKASENLGVAYNTAGLHEKAAGIFEALLGKRPRCPSVVLNLGCAYRYAGMIEKAVSCFLKVVEISNPGSSYHGRALESLDGVQFLQSRQRESSRRRE